MLLPFLLTVSQQLITFCAVAIGDKNVGAMAEVLTPPNLFFESAEEEAAEKNGFVATKGPPEKDDFRGFHDMGDSESEHRSDLDRNSYEQSDRLLGHESNDFLFTNLKQEPKTEEEETGSGLWLVTHYFDLFPDEQYFTYQMLLQLESSLNSTFEEFSNVDYE